MRKSISALSLALAASLILPAAVFAHWPVANRYSYVSQGYHSGHRGYDLASYSGTRVVPVRSGRVVRAGHTGTCAGIAVYISHGNGLYSTYYHLKAEYVYRGQWVTAQSTTIGRVGTTGCSTGPHLHLEIWRGYPWSSGAYRIRPWTFIDSGTYFPYRYR